MLIIITGKTASGKDTIIAKILTKYPSFKKILTTTSRSPREGEINRLNYYNFISKDQFQQKITKGDFLEYVEYGGNLYGTEKSQINPQADLIWKIDPSMAGKAKSLFPESLIIYITVDDQTVLKRLKERGLSNQEITKRIQDDQKFWQKYQHKYDYVVENRPGELDKTVEDLTNIIRARTARTPGR